MNILDIKQTIDNILIKTDKKSFKVTRLGMKYALNYNTNKEIIFNSLNEVKEYIKGIK